MPAAPGFTPAESSALAGLGSFADGLSVAPVPDGRTSNALAVPQKRRVIGQFHVPRKSLMKWLLTEDPTRPPPSYVPPGGRADHQPRVIIQSCFPAEYVPT